MLKPNIKIVSKDQTPESKRYAFMLRVKEIFSQVSNYKALMKVKPLLDEVNIGMSIDVPRFGSMSVQFWDRKSGLGSSQVSFKLYDLKAKDIPSIISLLDYNIPRYESKPIDTEIYLHKIYASLEKQFHEIMTEEDFIAKRDALASKLQDLWHEVLDLNPNNFK
jgi:hypothetical protein